MLVTMIATSTARDGLLARGGGGGKQRLFQLLLRLSDLKVLNFHDNDGGDDAATNRAE